MKTILAGSRHFEVFGNLNELMESQPFEITEIVSGHSGNVDLAGEEWATANEIPIKLFEPNWKVFGLSAGPKRNRQMAEYADVLIALWDGKSRGTKNMIEEMEKLKKPVYIYKETPTHRQGRDKKGEL